MADSRTSLSTTASDQKAIWTSPWHLRVQDARWLFPLAAGTGAVMAADHDIMLRLGSSSALASHSRGLGNYGVAAMSGTAAGFYLRGKIDHDEHSRETGLLTTEALADSMVVGEAMKLAFERPRPYAANAGSFGAGGASFPSQHALAAWSMASVIAQEYPGLLTRLVTYGAASGISLSRITAREHFPSDVVVGSALGYLVGQYVYRAHHNQDLPGAGSGAGWNVLDPTDQRQARASSESSSPYVPLDSWVYASLDRLAGLGYAPSAFSNLRPWTRMECARLTDAAGELLDGDEHQSEAYRLYAELQTEFPSELERLRGSGRREARIESVYTRYTGIAGTPLRDGYHFGQTMVNDFGRPYWTGFNSVSGLSAYAVAGLFAFSARGEYQHAPAVPSEPSSTLQATAAADGTGAFAKPIAQADRFRLLDATVALKLGFVQLSLGKESAWLGPTASGPLLFSDNAEPITMLKVDAVSPYRIPLISRFFGPVRSEFFVGRLAGQVWQFSPTLFGPGLRSQPFVHGTKLTFKPSPNLEIGAGFTAQFGGPGNPVTWLNFARTFYSHRTATGDNPAKRLSEFSFSYRVPGVRDWLTVYTDSMVIDEYSPVGSSRPALNPGVYLPRLPKLHKMEVRLEGVTTDLNVPSHFGPGAFYWDARYRSGYTSDGNLLGNWIGRRGRAEQAWATYSFSPRNTIQFGYRHNDVDKDFIGGGHVRDVGLRADRMVRHDLGLSSLVQYEDWGFPALSPAAKSDVAASLKLTWWPAGWKK